MSNSKIEWTERTWNPIVGCSVRSPGCTHCYAMPIAHRLGANPATPHYAGLTQMTKGGAVFTGKVACAPDSTWLEPLKRKKPTVYFVNSMGDLFHENVPDAWIDRAFATMALCPQHIFQVLTKRDERMRAYMADVEREARWMNEVAVLFERESWLTKRCHSILGRREPWLPLPNVWLGVSTERQKEADERIPNLLRTPAAVRFISAEPLLEAIDLTNHCNGHYFFDSLRGARWHDDPDHANPQQKFAPGLDWVIVGGESGRGARPMHPDWACSLRDQCAAAGVAFFFKQWGEFTTETVSGTNVDLKYDLKPNQCVAWGDGKTNHTRYTRVGKKHAGRKLDGMEHNAMPERAA